MIEWTRVGGMEFEVYRLVDSSIESKPESLKFSINEASI